VLDGQQRLTAIYYAFIAPETPLPNRSNRFVFFIRVDQFMEEAYDKAFEYEWTRAGIKAIEGQTAQFEKHVFPLAVVGKGGWALGNWVQAYEQFWKDKATEANRSSAVCMCRLARIAAIIPITRFRPSSIREG